MLTSALRRLFALAEAPPDLRAASNFAALQEELSETENRFAVARQIYKDSVLSYNNAVQTVPTNLGGRYGRIRVPSVLRRRDGSGDPAGSRLLSPCADSLP